ncbi:MAG: SET domain-containing protein-lysine N-methyltransferase [Anaerolineae bacterium]|nr:SET domain-containing protein-lysine N-methyltransferase [Anaerolineae bacterium]
MAQNQSPHYITSKAELRSCPEKGGYGVFCRELIKAGELLMVWGGEVVTEEQLKDIPVERSTHGLQVDDGIYLLPTLEGDPADYVNHSCNPNAGMRGQISLVAMTDIHPDEEICFDYAMTDSSDYDEFECHCGAPNCRKRITGNDWRIHELHQKYAGYFSTYLERKITSLYQQKTLSYQPPMWVTMRVAMYQ